MMATQIRHVQAAERLAQCALAEALGLSLYHDPAGNTFAVADPLDRDDLTRMRACNAFCIDEIPVLWQPGRAEPLGGWHMD